MYITDSTSQLAHNCQIGWLMAAPLARSNSCVERADVDHHHRPAVRRETGVSIDLILANTAFDAETVELLASAFDTAWDTIKKSGSPLAADENAVSTRDLLAKRIIKMAQQGERDRQQLVDDALAHLAAAK